MNITAYLRTLWMGSVTAPENVGWFIPAWLWSIFLFWAAVRRSSPQILFATFFVVFFVSSVPFFCRRVGLLRWWLFAYALPTVLAVVATQCIRIVFGFT